jgi:intracellular sulfur oxidation DsrE/DsrF family protein
MTAEINFSHHSQQRFIIFVLWLGMLLSVCHTMPAQALEINTKAPRVVFHIDQPEQAVIAIRVINNQRKVMPNAHITVIALGAGIDFLLDEAKDPNGNTYAALFDTLLLEGVQFKACLNTLETKGISPSELSTGVGTVRSGIAEITRLQWEENYAYIKP